MSRTDSPAFPFSENVLARTSGVSTKKMAETRKAAQLQKGADWDLVKNSVAYSPAGVERLSIAMGLPLVLPDAAAEPMPVAPAPQRDVTMGIVKKSPLNPHLFFVQVAGQAELVKLRVRKKDNFRLGMEVPMHREAGAEVFTLARKEPRFEGGRW